MSIVCVADRQHDIEAELFLYVCVFATVTKVGRWAYWQSGLGLGREIREWVWAASESKERWNRSRRRCLLWHKRHSTTVEPSGGQLLRCADTLWMALLLPRLQVRATYSRSVLFEYYQITTNYSDLMTVSQYALCNLSHLWSKVYQILGECMGFSVVFLFVYHKLF